MGVDLCEFRLFRYTWVWFCVGSGCSSTSIMGVVLCWSRCVSGMLEAKTRILVTRNLHILKAASRIAVLREVRPLAASYLPLLDLTVPVEAYWA